MERSVPPYAFNKQSAAWIREDSILHNQRGKKMKTMQACGKFSPLSSTNQIVQRYLSFMKCGSHLHLSCDWIRNCMGDNTLLLVWVPFHQACWFSAENRFFSSLPPLLCTFSPSPSPQGFFIEMFINDNEGWEKVTWRLHYSKDEKISLKRYTRGRLG